MADNNNNEQRLLILEIHTKDSQKRIETLEELVLEVREDMRKTLQEQNNQIGQLKDVFQHIYNAIRYSAIGGLIVLAATSEKFGTTIDVLLKLMGK